LGFIFVNVVLFFPRRTPKNFKIPEDTKTAKNGLLAVLNGTLLDLQEKEAQIKEDREGIQRPEYSASVSVSSSSAKLYTIPFP
jgi:hypothetical protein